MLQVNQLNGFGVVSGISGTVLSYDFTGVTSDANWPVGWDHLGGDIYQAQTNSNYLAIQYTFTGADEVAVAQIRFTFPAEYAEHKGGVVTFDSVVSATPTQTLAPSSPQVFAEGATKLAFQVTAYGTNPVAYLRLDNVVITFN